jgi:HEPN domain-containing protein
MADQEIYRRWLERVFYDMETAKAMLRTGRLIYAIFMCQQAIEKCFKAVISFKDPEIVPIHNLRRLAEISGVIRELDESKLMKLDFLSSYYINARYKEDLSELSRGITDKTA